MKKIMLVLVTLVAILFFACGRDGKLVIATVNNPDMIIMKDLTPEFTKATGIEVQYVVLPENDLRQKVTQDVALNAGNFDIVTIGPYDAPIWARNGWISPLNSFFDEMDESARTAYDLEDIFPAVRSAFTVDGQLYALPLYTEGSMIYYRKDLFEQAGLTMPYEPTWEQIYEFAKKLHNPSGGVYGIVLRGLPGWGQNMAPFTSMIHAFGARWFDTSWTPQFDSTEMRNVFGFYKKILAEAGEPGPTSVGFTEALAIMASGKAAMWYDATVGAGFLQRDDAVVKGKVGYALAPTAKKKNTTWFWSWALAVEAASKNKDAAFSFLTWATSKEYIALVGAQKGWAQAPAGTRVSTYKNEQYLAAADFAKITEDSIANADYDKPAVQSVPYRGIQYVLIPEFQGLGEKVAQELAAYITDQKSLDDVLAASQAAALEVAVSGGYKKVR